MLKKKVVDSCDVTAYFSDGYPLVVNSELHSKVLDLHNTIVFHIKVLPRVPVRKTMDMMKERCWRLPGNT